MTEKVTFRWLFTTCGDEGGEPGNHDWTSGAIIGFDEHFSGVLCVTPLSTEWYDMDGFQQALKYLRYPKHDVYVIHVVDEEEESPDVRGDLRLVDSEAERFQEINVTDELLRRYRVAFEELCGNVESYCIRNEMGYVRARTDLPFDELVLRILRRGGLVG